MEANGIQGLSEDEDSSLLIADAGGLRRLIDGQAVMKYPFPSSTPARILLRDRDGGVWAGTSTRGLVHVHDGITDVFSQADGLSGDNVSAIVEDREGTIWVATNGGLDHFRESAVVERTRVARELHDTLLQTFHGVLFRFHAAVNMLPERPAEAKEKFERAIDRAAQAITEGRDAIQDLRASTVVTNDLAVAITTLGDELAASGVNGNATVVDVAVQVRRGISIRSSATTPTGLPAKRFATPFATRGPDRGGNHLRRPPVPAAGET